VWTWYAVDGVGEPTATDAKLRELRHAVLRQSPESAVFVLTAIGGDEKARAHLLEQATRAAWDWYRLEVFPP
jgi:predicted O-linked N-acetylglucosamine transferase (SPINDLY family)